MSKLSLIYDDLRKYKNIKKLAYYGVIIIGLLTSFIIYQKIKADSFQSESYKLDTINSIAILPFKNLNNDAEYEYYSTGVVEAINRLLSQISDLKVIPLTSTDQYYESGKSAREIGKELSVSKLLEGSIQRHENLVRLKVRLIDVDTESQIWAENYDFELKNIIFTISEIAGKVVLALKTTLSPEEKKVLDVQGTLNAVAYDLYLKGIYESRTYTRTGNIRAIEYFQQAIRQDSNFALAYAGLAVSTLDRASVFGAELSAVEALGQAKIISRQGNGTGP
jgi:adenylate cyclase